MSVEARKQLLIAGLILLIAIALATVSFAFINYAKVPEQLQGERVALDLSTLNEGEFRLFGFPREYVSNVQVLLIKDWDGRVYTYLLPTKDGKITMPDTRNGWYGYYGCLDFSPELESTTKIKKDGHIICHDKDAMVWNRDDWQWSYDGRPMGNQIPPMLVPRTERDNNILYIIH